MKQDGCEQFRNHKVIYRRYAGLFFCICVDANDNELAYLEAIHLFVEVLGECRLYTASCELFGSLASDSFFDNVCELDLVFNFYKVRLPLNRPLTYRSRKIGVCHP